MARRRGRGLPHRDFGQEGVDACDLRIAARFAKATLGGRVEEPWTAALFTLALSALVASVGFGVAALLPREYVTLGMGYVRSFPTWSQIFKPPEQVRGDTMRGLVEAIAQERSVNDRKAHHVKRALLLLAIGLSLVALEAATLAWTEAL